MRQNAHRKNTIGIRPANFIKVVSDFEIKFRIFIQIYQNQDKNLVSI